MRPVAAPRTPTRRVLALLVGLDCAFIFLVTSEYRRLHAPAVVGFLTALHRVAICYLVPALVRFGGMALLLRPVERWRHAEAQGTAGPAEMAPAMRALHAAPERIGLLCASTWILMYALATWNPWTTVRPLPAVMVLFLSALFLGALVLDTTLVRAVLTPDLRRLSAAALERRIELCRPRLTVRRRLVVFAVCLGLTPGLYATSSIFSLRPESAHDAVVLVNVTVQFIALGLFAALNASMIASTLTGPVTAMSTVLHGISRRGAVASAGRIAFQVRDEIGLLAEEANVMIDRLERAEGERASVMERLEEMNRTLEDRVRSRTRELADAQAQLLHASRRAGMAQVATNILHSVGNALNSIHTSAGVAQREVRAMRAGRVRSAAALLEGQTATRTDEIREYLSRLGDSLEQGQNRVGEEMDRLREHLDHVSTVVARQQQDARGLEVLTLVDPGQLVTDALAMFSPSLERNQIAVTTSLDDLPVTELDRSRVLDILLNLLGNAADALGAVPPGERRIALALRRTEDGFAYEVSDSGTGIAPEHAAEIFRYGFTTKPGGHGFGLHFCELTARQMGGALTFGLNPDRGVTFTLSFPRRERAQREAAQVG
jgi:signal transduction histidine kinase